MAAKRARGLPQLVVGALDAVLAKQGRARYIRQVFQSDYGSRGPGEMIDVGDALPRGDDTETWIAGRQLSHQRLQGRILQLSSLGAGWVL